MSTCRSFQGSLTRVVDACLDDVVQRESAGSLLVSQLLVHVQGEYFGHVVVVSAEVWKLFLCLVVHFELDV